MSWGPCKRVSLSSFDAFFRELTLWYNTATPYNFYQPATETYYGTQNPFQWLSNQFGCASNTSQQTLNPYSGCFDPSLNAPSSVYTPPIPAYNYGQNSVGYQYGHYPSGLTLTPAEATGLFQPLMLSQVMESAKIPDAASYTSPAVIHGPIQLHVGDFSQPQTLEKNAPDPTLVGRNSTVFQNTPPSSSNATASSSRRTKRLSKKSQTLSRRQPSSLPQQESIPVASSSAQSHHTPAGVSNDGELEVTNVCCSKTFRDSRTYRRHLNEKHRINGVNGYECPNPRCKVHKVGKDNYARNTSFRRHFDEKDHKGKVRHGYLECRRILIEDYNCGLDEKGQFILNDLEKFRVKERRSM